MHNGSLTVFQAGARTRRHVCALAMIAGCVAGSAAAQSNPWSGGLPVILQPDESHLPAEPGAPWLQDHLFCGKACSARARLIEGGTFGGEDEPPILIPGLRGVMAQTDVLHNDLEINLFPATSSITGVCTMTVRALSPSLSEFVFMLRSNMNISAATISYPVGAPGVPVTLSSTGSYGRRAAWTTPIPQGEVFTLRIEYDGAPAARGFGSFQFAQVAGQTVVSTLSEPYFAATWWPCKDGDFGVSGDNSDKATLSIAISAPSALRSVSAGLLQGIDALPGGRTRYRWATSYPMATYLVHLCATVYNTWTVPYNFQTESGPASMPVEFNIYPAADTPANRAEWEKVLPMLSVFESVFGPYPFRDEKYGIYQFPFSGGMEHQTNSGQGVFVESLSAHELAHQWWGDDVTCRTWNDIWLNEGFASYSEALWEERKPGSSGLPALRAAMLARKPTSVDGSVYRTDVANFSSIFNSNMVYRKGGWVLHMLRRRLGDETFFACIRAHRAQHSGGAAVTEDFIATCEAVSGRDLREFFDPWIYGVGAPEFTYGWENLTYAGVTHVRISLKQIQPAAYGFYPMPVDVVIDTAAGSVHAVVNSENEVDYAVIALPAPATAVHLDPDDWILMSGSTPGESSLPRPCDGDYNLDGTWNVQDLYDYLSEWAVGVPRTDVSRSGGITVQDLYDFLASWNLGCP